MSNQQLSNGNLHQLSQNRSGSILTNEDRDSSPTAQTEASLHKVSSNLTMQLRVSPIFGFTPL